VLHPRHKLTYFKSAGWQQEWIKTAEGLVWDEFTCVYSTYDIEMVELVKKSDGSSKKEVHELVVVRLWLIYYFRVLMSLTTYQRWHHRSSMICRMNSTVISAWTLNMSWMHLLGGMSTVQSILSCHTWHSTTYQFLVSTTVTIYVVTSVDDLLQQPPLMLSVSSAMVVSSSLMSNLAYLPNQLVHFCVWDVGAYKI